MSLKKTLSLAAVVAAVTIALIGAPSAAANPSSVVLCGIPELKCPQIMFVEDFVLHEHAINPQLLSSLGTMLCELSLALVELLNKLDTSVIYHLLELNFVNCHLGETKCEVKTNETGGLEFTHGENPLVANVTMVPEEGEETAFTVKCGSLINCKYGGEANLTAHSSESGELKLLTNGTELKSSGFLCPKNSKWDAVYTTVEEGEGSGLEPMLGLYIES